MKIQGYKITPVEQAVRICFISQPMQWLHTKAISEIRSQADLETLTLKHFAHHFLNFIRGKKVQNFAWIFHSVNFYALCFKASE